MLERWWAARAAHTVSHSSPTASTLASFAQLDICQEGAGGEEVRALEKKFGRRCSGGGGGTAKKLKACKTETSERFTAHQAETALLLDITSAS